MGYGAHALSAEAVNKYRNIRTEVDGVSFHSKKEASRWRELKLLERAGHIFNLKRQVPYGLDVEGIHITRYIADFVYVENGTEVVEDAKGIRTPVYRLKKKLMYAIYGITIRET